MSALPPRKILIINLCLLLGTSAILFQVYLPTLDEIISQNQQLSQYEKQLKMLSLYPEASKTQARPTVYALPVVDKERLSQELEILAQKHGLRLIRVESSPDLSESMASQKIQLTPYIIGIEAKEPKQLASLWADLENHFPELLIQKISYEKEVATFEARLLTSSQSVRLFAP